MITRFLSKRLIPALALVLLAALFSVHRGSRILPAQINGSAKNGQQNLFVSASIEDRKGADSA